MSEEVQKRFDRFKSSLNVRLSPQHPAKRFRRDSLDDLNPPFSKRICRDLPKQPTKNIANSRLQKIKDKLRLEVLAEPSRPQSASVSSKISNNDQSKVISNSEIPSSAQTPKNIYYNPEKWASSPDHSQNNKNLANQRMNRLRKKVFALDTLNEKCTSSDTTNKEVCSTNKTLESSNNCTITKNKETSIIFRSDANADLNQNLKNDSLFRLTSSDNFKPVKFNVHDETHRSPLLIGSHTNLTNRSYKFDNVFTIYALPDKNNETTTEMFKPSSVTDSAQKLHFTSRTFKKPVSDSHRSPLRTGVKRLLNDNNFECGSPKRKAFNLEPIENCNVGKTSPRIKDGSFRKNYSFESKESLEDISVDSPQPETPKKISDRLKRFNAKKETNLDSSGRPKTCNEKEESIEKDIYYSPVESIVHSTQNISRKIEPSDSFSARMQRTALWVKNICGDNSLLKDSKSKGTSYETDLSSCSKVPLPDDDIEEMEWTNAEPDEEKAEINEEDSLQKNINDAAHEPVDQKQEKLKNICIIVDTNIFISNLSKVKDILSMKKKGSIDPVIYIPWMVITELDYMKDNEHCKVEKLKLNIMKSIKFINTCLKEKHPQLIAQTIYEVEKQKQIGPSQDDKIVSCCLQVAEKYETVILLSNDINLKNKVMISGITACSANEIIMKIMSKLVTSVKLKRVQQKMSILCSSIICECAKETFGNVWSKMDMLSCPPWSFFECLKRFKKYWGTIFQDKLMKQFTKTLDDLMNLLNNNKCIADDSEDYVKFVQLCITLGVYLKDIETCRGSVENTLKDITHKIS